MSSMHTFERYKVNLLSISMCLAIHHTLHKIRLSGVTNDQHQTSESGFPVVHFRSVQKI